MWIERNRSEEHDARQLQFVRHAYREVQRGIIEGALCTLHPVDDTASVGDRITRPPNRYSRAVFCKDSIERRHMLEMRFADYVAASIASAIAVASTAARTSCTRTMCAPCRMQAVTAASVPASLWLGASSAKSPPEISARRSPTVRPMKDFRDGPASNGRPRE